MSWLEIAANAFTVVCIFLAGRNNVHTWWTGIVACILFGALFMQANLYADVTLQVFFVITSLIGWVYWKGNSVRLPVPLTKAPLRTVLTYYGVAILAASVYGSILHSYTNAYAPFIDSLVLTLSVVAQLMLMTRRVNAWGFWTYVNILSVPLYFSRELYLTAGLYSVFLVHSIYSIFYWDKLYNKQLAAKA